MIRKSWLVLGILSSVSLFAQDELIKKVINNASLNSKFEFREVTNISTTSVKSQGSAGTCWSYSGTSFLETEMIRNGKQPVDLAEIFTARQVYLGKARNFVLFNGNLGLGDGGETHDVLNIFRKNGAMPQQAYTLEDYGKGVIKSSEFQDGFKAILDAYVKNPSQQATWVQDVNAYMGIEAADYLEFTNYKDSPYYEKMVLPVPDNWSYDMVYNVPMTELTDIIDYALSKGYTIAWSSDVSEPYFSWRNGVAFVPDMDLNTISPEQKKTLFDGPTAEKTVTEELRLEGLYNLTTTDDHAMQIVGVAKDQNGKDYYKVKNSWGESNDYKGFLYVTKAYVQLKSTGILLHKLGVPKSTKQKIKVM